MAVPMGTKEDVAVELHVCGSWQPCKKFMVAEVIFSDSHPYLSNRCQSSVPLVSRLPHAVLHK